MTTFIILCVFALALLMLLGLIMLGWQLGGALARGLNPDRRRESAQIEALQAEVEALQATQQAGKTKPLPLP